MKTHHSKTQNTHVPGFALIVTLSLMILLTVIAVGLLTLASVSMRTSANDDSAAIARNNARLALMLAIGDLQKQMGPDTRISVNADQIAGSSPETPAAPQGQRQWTGAYKAWPAALPSAARPTPEFLQWFVSGNQNDLKQKEYATSGVSSDPKNSVEIVSSHTVGTGETVKVPKITQTVKNGGKNGFAWWVGDQGTKALIARSKAEPVTLGDTRADLQAIPTTNLQLAKIDGKTPFAHVEGTDEKFARVHSWESAELLAGNGTPAEIGELFHDFTTQSRGLLTNVRAGGFRKDLSMEFEKAGTAFNPVTSALYKVGAGDIGAGINMQELWSYYNICSSSSSIVAPGSGVNWAQSAPYTSGGSLSSKSPCLMVGASASACADDNFFYYKQPVIINYQLLLSLKTEGGVIKIVTDPIITFWNPLDVPVVVPGGQFFTVKYWQVPYNLKIRKGSTSYLCPVTPGTDSNIMSLEMGKMDRLVFKPGEVIRMSQATGTSATYTTLQAQKGYSLEKGVSWNAVDINDTTRKGIPVANGESVTFEGAIPNDLTAGATTRDGKVRTGNDDHSRHFSLTHHEYYIGADRSPSDQYTESLGVGGIYLDYDYGDKRLPATTMGPRAKGSTGTKPSGDRYNALNHPSIFPSFLNVNSPVNAIKSPIMLFSFHVKTETSPGVSTRVLSRFNPKALQVDFYDLQPKEREMLPYEYKVELVDSFKNDKLDGKDAQGYFGAAMNSTDGSNFVITHSVPREPITSLAAFQHSFANGFNMQKPAKGYSTLNAREPLLPQISHAIGNSLACPVIDKDKTEGTLVNKSGGSRPLADHSYLANQALFDDWFLSGIAPQNINSFPKNSNQRQVATAFLTHLTTGTTPVSRYIANTRGKDSATILSSLFSGNSPKPTTAAAQMASYIQVDGLFNVNSTSVEAWKSLLASRNGRKIVTRDANGGKESFSTMPVDNPVSGLFSPANVKADGSPHSLSDEAQWTGYRALTDNEIDSLARGIVKEVRKRGPFISLADFINRRVGTNEDLARAGAIQSALDSNDVTVNKSYNTGSRASAGGSAMSFNGAEKGPKSYGIPGIVKQADILTPIAPILAARSDSFVIRGYGEKTDASGKVLARAWCEAVVERSAEFVDSADAPEKTYSTINSTNVNFGRRFQIVSFRWLNPSEA